VLQEFSDKRPELGETAYCRYALARIHEREGRTEEAVAAAQRAANLAPDDSSVKALLERLNAELDAKTATRKRIEELESALTDGGFRVARELASAYQGIGDRAQAAATLISLAREQSEAPEAADMYMEAAEMSLQGDDEDRARACYGEVVVLYPGTPQAEKAWHVLAKADIEKVPRLPRQKGQIAVPESTLAEAQNLFAKRMYTQAISAAMPTYRRLAICDDSVAVAQFGASLHTASVTANTVCAALESLRQESSSRTGAFSLSGELDPMMLYVAFSGRPAHADLAESGLPADQRAFLQLLYRAWGRDKDAKVISSFVTTRNAIDARDEETLELTYAYALTIHPATEIERFLEVLPEDLNKAAFAIGAGDFCAELGEESRARQLYQLAAASASEGEWKIAALQKCADLAREVGDYSEAVAAYREIVKQYAPAETAAKAQEAIIDILAQDWKSYQNAARECENLTVLFPGTKAAERAEYLAGEYHYRDKNYSEAIRHLEEFLERHSDSPWAEAAEMVIGLAQVAEGHTDAAIRTFRELTERYPVDESTSKAQYLIGYCYLSTQRYDEALREFQNLVNNYPDSAYAAKAQEFISKLQSAGTVSR